LRTSRSRLTIAASATAFALAVTIAATSWAFESTGASQAISHLPTSSRPHWSSATGAPSAGAASGAETGLAGGSAFAQTLTLASVPSAGERRAVQAREIAWRMLRTFRWRPRFQFRYLKWLWDRESSWNVYATNPYSGAYGIPQAEPGYKMSSAGRRWRTSPWVQIRWGLRYIRGRYGSPRAAWGHEVAYGWY
jgi:hypothetical protein